MNKIRKKKGVSLIMLAFGLATLLGFAALAIDLGNAFNVQNQLQKATNSAVLAGASSYNPYETSTNNINNIKKSTEESFNLSKKYEQGLANAEIVGNIQVDTDSGALRMQTKAGAHTFFIGILGIKTLEVNSRAAAMNYPVPYIIMNDLPGVAAGKKKATLSFPETKKNSAASINGYGLTAGSKIQIVATLPLVNAPGPEVTVVEMGDLDGYLVFVASKPTGPWYNITASGVSLETGGPGPAVMPPSFGKPANYMRFFGSGSFDLEGSGIENARYVGIVDDNSNDGYLETDLTTLVDSSTFTSVSEISAGADIDAIAIHQHSIAITYDDLSKDNDGDGTIDAYNNVIGTYEKPGSKAKDKDATEADPETTISTAT